MRHVRKAQLALHNPALRADRERRRGRTRTLVPAGAGRVLVLGDVPIELPGARSCAWTVPIRRDRARRGDDLA